MQELKERVVAAHDDICVRAKALKPSKTLDVVRLARWQGARPARQRFDGTGPGRGHRGSTAPVSDPLVARIDRAESAYVRYIADAQTALRLAGEAELDLKRLCDDRPYYADGARQCRGFQRVPHKTTNRFVRGYCKTCDDRRRYAERAVTVSDNPG